MKLNTYLKYQPIVLVWFYALFLCLSLQSQHSTTSFDFTNIKAGKSNVGVTTIIQDHYGFVWFGTAGVGLSRFDGIEYVNYNHSLEDATSISSSLVYCSYLDKNNRLWFGTEEGLNLYNRDLDEFIRIPLLNPNTQTETNVSIRSICSDRGDNLYIGTYGTGLYKLNLKTLEAEKIKNPTNDSDSFLAVYSVKCNTKGRLFAGTNLGLLEYTKAKNKLEFLKLNNKESLLNTPIHSLLIDEENIWIGTESEGLIYLKNQNSDLNDFKKIYSKVTTKKIFSIIKLSDDTVLCGSENDGLLQINTNGQLVNKYLYDKNNENSLLSNSIWSLFLDNDKRVWIGYYNSGVGIYDNLHDKFNHIKSLKNNKNSLSNPSVTGLVENKKGELWISMDGGGIDILNKKNKSFTHINSANNEAYKGLNSDYLECVFIDSNSNVWIGSWNDGIYFLPNGSKQFINYTTKNTNGALASNTILSITEDADGTIWIGSFYKGVHSYNFKNNTFTRYNSKAFIDNKLIEADVRKIMVDSKQDIWIGTTQGLYKLIKDNNSAIQVISYVDSMAKEFNNYITSSHILTLYESLDKQKIYIGTRGAGLCEFNRKNKTFKWHNNQTGFDGVNITGITESNNNNLWISSNSGLYKYDLKSLKFTNFTYNDGLLSNDFNVNAVYHDKSDNIYFGNYQGVDYFNPNSISLNTNLPAVYLTDFKLFNKKVLPNTANSPLNKVISETKEITLNHKQSVFTIEFTAINYTRPEKNQFAYYLEGLENSWNYVGNTRNATYTNLDYGTYTFKLKAANNDGIWNETPNSLLITILPPWWKSTIALCTYIVLFIFVLFILNKIIQNRTKEKQLINYERETRKQKEILNEKKFQFFTNISHEFRTPLTLIINPLEDILKNKALSIPEIVITKLKTVHKNTDRLNRLITELLDFRKLEFHKVRIKVNKLNLVYFIQNVVSHFKEEAIAKNITLSVDTDNADIMLWADRSMLEKIIFNLLSNALKITPNGGLINVDIKLKSDKVLMPLVNTNTPITVAEIIISDSGPGIDENEVEKIFDRFYQVGNLNNTYYGGTGIGLEVVKSFVQLHKGNIKVKSKLGFGTQFIIHLPTEKFHFQEDQISTEIQHIKESQNIYTTISSSKEYPIQDTTQKAIPEKSHALLIVEDNLELQKYLKEELEQEYIIYTATNGFDGLEIATKISPDVIITDVIMPKMDGFEFCKNIKSDIKTSHIPLLMLTAKARIDNRMEGIELGADAYMVKPFNLRLLKLRIAQLITSRKLIFNKYFSVISELPENVKTTSIDKEFIEKVLNYINENISDPNLNVEILASKLNLSKSQFYRKIKALTNQTANEFLRNIRLQKAKQILELGSATVGEVSFKVGFSSHSYFTKCFKNYYGVLPTRIETKS